MVIIAIAAACCVGTKNRIVDIVCTSPTRAVLPLPRRTYVRFSPNPRPRLLCFAETGRTASEAAGEARDVCLSATT